MTTSQHGPDLPPPSSPRARAASRRAADELLIAAIFGADYEPLRGGETAVAPAPTPSPAPVAL